MSNGRIGPPWWLMARGGAGEYRTVSGPVAHWKEKVVAPLKSLLVNIDPVQAGSGDPSPDNVRPITGWTGANVWVQPTHDTTATPTVNIAFPAEAGTVYGGTLDVVSGVLTVNMVSVDLGTLSYATYSSGTYRVFRSQSLRNRKFGEEPDVYGISDIFKWFGSDTLATLTGMGDKQFGFQVTNTFIVIRDDDYTTVEAFTNAVSGHMLVYPIYNPLTYQLTPQDVMTLLGTNNIWADTGDVTVEYLSGEGNPALVALALAHRIEE